MAKVGPALARHAAGRPQTAATSAIAVAERAAAATAAPIRQAPHLPAVPARDANEFEINPAVAVGKGTSGAPFAISWKSQHEVVMELAWKSSLCIWGGPVLTLACLYILSISLGWISP